MEISSATLLRMSLKTPKSTDSLPRKKDLRALITLVDGTEYESEILMDGEMNVRQKFLAKVQSDGGLWAEGEVAGMTFLPWHAILYIHFLDPE